MVKQEASMATHQLLKFETDLGRMWMLVQPRYLCRLNFGSPTSRTATQTIGSAQFEVAQEPQAAWQSQLMTALCRYAQGEPQRFSDVPLHLSWLTPFARRVIHRCRQIPFGTTVSYSELAAQVGSPKAARAVGNAMARNRFPLVVPCHRVVGARQTLGGFSAGPGVALKRRLLRLEGAHVGVRNRDCPP